MSNPIRVLHVFGKLNTGGAESRTMEIYRNINRDKVQFDFAIHTDEKCFYTDEIEELGGKIHSLPRFNGLNYFEYKNAWIELFKKNKNYKIVHGHQTSTAFIYLNIAKKYNIPIRIAHARNSKKDSVFKNFTCKLSRFYANELFAVSKLAGESEFGKNRKFKVLPNAIDSKKYEFNKSIRTKVRKELGIEDRFVIVHIGRFHPQKNHDFLLEIMSKVIRKNNKAFLILIGEGELKDKINEKIYKLGLVDYVKLLGVRSDIPDLLQAMDLLLFPSLYEGLPGVVLEAQAAGLQAVISENISKEAKITNLVKFLSLKKDAEYWANEIFKFSKKHNRNRSSRVEEIIQAGFDIEENAKWYENFYLKKYFNECIKREKP